MSIHTAPAPCGSCCSSLYEYIAQHLDPGNELGHDIERGEITAANVEQAAAETVASLDSVFVNEGGSGIDASDMEAYLTDLIEEAADECPAS